MASKRFPEVSWRRFSSKCTILAAQLGASKSQKKREPLRGARLFWLTGLHLAIFTNMEANLERFGTQLGAILEPNVGTIGIAVVVVVASLLWSSHYFAFGARPAH